MRSFVCLSLLSILPASAFAQSTETASKFEVADVHSSPRTSTPIAQGPFFSNGRYELRFATMRDLVHTAYDVDPERIYGGPSWLEMDRFDIFARVQPGSTVESRRLMLQALLADRFKLVVHKDTRPATAFALTAAKNNRLQQSDGSGEPGCHLSTENTGSPDGATPGVIRLPTIVYTCRNTTMASFASQILDMPQANQILNNRLVVDQTGLEGAWDFTLKFTPRVPAGIPVSGESIPMPAGLEKIGLKLELAKVPLPVLVVDSVEEKPTANSPEVAKAFPPLPTEFEVADIKLSPPGPPGGQPNRQPDIKNGRLYLPGMSLKNLILIAWDLNGDEHLVNAPKWLDDDRFDILAKAPTEVNLGDLALGGQRSSISLNIEAIRPMLRSLVIDRFKLVAHTEERPLNGYVLTAPKPKLTKADPAERTKWHEGVDPDAKDAKNINAALGRVVTCQNVTMAQFAEMLPMIAGGYVHSTVVDRTGLKGGWDFTFYFSPAGALQFNAPRDPNAPGGGLAAQDPNGAISLPDAVAKQLGLKLDQQKLPAQVLVIESVERRPTEN